MRPTANNALERQRIRGGRTVLAMDFVRAAAAGALLGSGKLATELIDS